MRFFSFSQKNDQNFKLKILEYLSHLSKVFLRHTQKNNTALFKLIILYKVNYLYPLGYRKQKIIRLHRTAFCFCDDKEKRHWNTFVSVGHRAEKFNVVSNDHGRTHKWDFSVFDQKYPFQANLVKKVKTLSLSWN